MPDSGLRNVDLAGIHQGRREDILAAIYEQTKQIHRAEQPEVSCPCGNTLPQNRLFKCFYCEVYFCKKCGKEHFGAL